MIIIACVDNNLGVAFNNRRQSRDRKVCERILSQTGDKKLWMNGYSAKLFGEQQQICVDEDFMNKAKAEDYCFVETAYAGTVNDYEKLADKVVIYKWNRDYPADTFWNLDLSDWKLVSSEDLAGNSHEKITEEVYVK